VVVLSWIKHRREASYKFLALKAIYLFYIIIKGNQMTLSNSFKIEMWANPWGKGYEADINEGFGFKALNRGAKKALKELNDTDKAMFASVSQNKLRIRIDRNNKVLISSGISIEDLGFFAKTSNEGRFVEFIEKIDNMDETKMERLVEAMNDKNITCDKNITDKNRNIENLISLILNTNIEG
jgi:hypothetical protein